MRKIKNAKSTKTIKEPMSFKTKAIILGASGVLLLLMIVLIIVESEMKNVRVKNDTDNLRLEYVEAYFTDYEGPVVDDDNLYNSYEFANLEPGEKTSTKVKSINLLGREANLRIKFKFENHDESFVDAGYFNDNFSGNIKIEFDQEEEESIILKVKAKDGLFSSTLTDCDEIFKFDYVTGEEIE